jgi:hypothetical protein
MLDNPTRQARLALRLSQDELAVAIRDAGQRLGTPHGCSKRLVPRWEAGQVALPRSVNVRALEYITGTMNGGKNDLLSDSAPGSGGTG